MNGEVYISGIYQMGELGDKLGVRTKWRGEEWDAASFILPIAPDHGYEAVQQSAKGHHLSLEQFPEGEAVWNEKAFAKARDFLWLSGFLAVKQKVADVLSRFDLGGGELVPVPLVKADLETPWPEPFYYINYGGPKDTLLPDESKGVRFRNENPATGQKIYDVGFEINDGDIALSQEARLGSDIWLERSIRGKLFLSGDLVDGLRAANVNVDLRVAACRVIRN